MHEEEPDQLFRALKEAKENFQDILVDDSAALTLHAASADVLNGAIASVDTSCDSDTEDVHTSCDSDIEDVDTSCDSDTEDVPHGEQKLYEG